jgi:hypothetical protein
MRIGKPIEKNLNKVIVPCGVPYKIIASKNQNIPHLEWLKLN